jgi:hypothetical protein
MATLSDESAVGDATGDSVMVEDSSELMGDTKDEDSS